MSDQLRHWQPVLASRRLGRKPTQVVVDGREIVLFRTASGRVGALQGRCPHRGMLLSAGKVVGERLRCSYHGWCFGPDGNGFSPGAPRVPQRAVCYDTADRAGLIWLKDSASPEPFPELAPPGYRHCSAVHGAVPAPLELLLDNFTEIEHTAATHMMFGYSLERLHEVAFQSKVEDSTVRNRSAGPQKAVPPWTAATMGIRTGDRFVVEWVTRGDPLHVRYEMHWEDPRTGRPRPSRVHEIAYFRSLGERRSAVAALYFLQLPPSRVPGMSRMIMKSVAALIEVVEFPRDMRLMRALEWQEPSLRNCRLSRFDASLSAQRKLFFPE